MKKIILLLVVATLLYTRCEDGISVDPRNEGAGSFSPLQKYPSDLAVEWMKLQMRISRTSSFSDTCGYEADDDRIG